MSDRFRHASESVFAVLVIVLLIGLGGCGGGSSHSNFVTPPPPGTPSVSTVSPPSGFVGESVSVIGSNFGSTQGSNTVTVGGKTASVVSWADSVITVTVPSGAISGSVAVSISGTPTNAVAFSVITPPGSIARSNFGFQCGIGNTADCEGTSTPIVWPTTQAQPGLIRLHDAGTQWAVIDPVGGGAYKWNRLDAWLDLIAQRQTIQPVEVSEVFTWVPCWDAPAPCTAPPTAPAGTSTPPGDLSSSGSTGFNSFVTAFVQHCSPAGNCVNKLIRYYEMWNEWDLQFHWTGTMRQLYQMLAPAVAIIRQNYTDPNFQPIVMTPSTTPDSDTGVGYQCDFLNWLNYENANGRISDMVAWHDYLTATATSTNSPEVQWSKSAQAFVAIQLGGSVNGCSSGSTTAGFSVLPWANTETNFNGAPPPGLNYTCPAAQFSADDCTGQIVRWQLLHDSNGASGLDWYKWNETIGAVPQYETAYYYMIQYLVGGTFAPSQPCSSSDQITWTCNFTEASGTQALWVWTPSEAGTSFSVPSGYVDYLDLTGNKTSVSSGQSITIGVMPIMLEH